MSEQDATALAQALAELIENEGGHGHHVHALARQVLEILPSRPDWRAIVAPYLTDETAIHALVCDLETAAIRSREPQQSERAAWVAEQTEEHRQRTGFCRRCENVLIYCECGPVSAAPRAGQWQPIATAKRHDGERVLLYWETRGACSGYWHVDEDDAEEYGWRGDEDLCIPRDQYRCTHWMPLPDAPPSAAAPRAGQHELLPTLGKGVDPHYFVTLAEIFRTNDNWIIFQFREGGTIGVPIHEDHNCVLAEPERH